MEQPTSPDSLQSRQPAKQPWSSPPRCGESEENRPSCGGHVFAENWEPRTGNSCVKTRQVEQMRTLRLPITWHQRSSSACARDEVPITVTITTEYTRHQVHKPVATWASTYSLYGPAVIRVGSYHPRSMTLPNTTDSSRQGTYQFAFMFRNWAAKLGNEKTIKENQSYTALP